MAVHPTAWMKIYANFRIWYVLDTPKSFISAVDWTDTLSVPLMSLRPARNMSLGRWLLVACFSSVKNHNVSGPHLFPSFSTHAKKIPLTPRTVLHWAKNPFAIGRNSERCFYHIDLSWFVLPVSDPSALNFSQFVGFQNFPDCIQNEKVAETFEFDAKETLFSERATGISKRVLGWVWGAAVGCTLTIFSNDEFVRGDGHKPKRGTNSIIEFVYL